jgi:hypothetical protein
VTGAAGALAVAGVAVADGVVLVVLFTRWR